MEAFVFQNEARQQSTNSYLQFQFKGNASNTFAIGTYVKLFFEKEVMVQELMPSRGFQSSVDYVMTFGLGKYDKVDSISVRWPDNKVTILKDVKVNQRLTLSQTDAIEWKGPSNPSASAASAPLMVEVKASDLQPHQENNFDDFDQERLVTKGLSREGPALATGDINGDGNEDVFVGGAKDQAGKVYVHEGDGKLRLLPSSCFADDAAFEDTAAAFLDADGDGDLDLVVGGGGNIATEKESYGTRLYLNNGKGQFTRSANTLPSRQTNIAVIAPNDFDGDGDVDLFIGSRSVPGVYGVNPEHLLLVNHGNGTFADATDRFAYDLRNTGMITDARWADVDGDTKLDLITTSDWGAPTVLKNSGRRLSKWNSTLDSLSGWWKAVEAVDVDNDGDQDLILGNAGLNIPYPATMEKPVKLWVNDFDTNGTIEQITTAHDGEGDYPIHMRREVTTQLPHLKKQNLKAADYSKRTIQELFDPKIVSNSLVKTATISESIIAVNQGNGKFSIVKLPARVQWSCVCGILCADLNNDGNKDLIMGGNFFEYKPQFSRQDASYGHVLLGDGKMNFEWQNFSDSGFFVREEIRHLQSFTDKRGRKYILAAINDEKPRVFKYNAQ
jgi:hypothetical protein